MIRNMMELRRYILLISGRILKWSTVDSLSDKWGYLRATLPPVDTAEGEQRNTQPARNMNAFGFRSAPVAGSECIVGAPRAGSTNATVIASDHLGYGPVDLHEGDAVAYSDVVTGAGTRVRLYGAHYEAGGTAPGTIEIHAQHRGRRGSELADPPKAEVVITTSAGATVQLDGDGKIILTSKDGASATLDNQIVLETPAGAKLTMGADTLSESLLRVTHLGGNSAAARPTVAPGAALQGGTAVIAGSDFAFTLIMTAGPPPPGIPGVMATVTFGAAYSTPPAFSLSPAAIPITAVATTTQLVFTAGAPVVPGTPITVAVICVQPL